MRRLIVEMLREDGNDVQEAPDGGRMLVEQRHDLDALARRLVDDLGLAPAGIPTAALAHLDAELDALGTPAGSPVAIRALRRCAGVAGAGDWSELTGRRR